MSKTGNCFLQNKQCGNISFYSSFEKSLANIIQLKHKQWKQCITHSIATIDFIGATNTTDNLSNVHYSIMNFNCYGLKSSYNMILNQMDDVNCMFLCETWLKPCDLGTIKNDLINRGYWCMMKSSVDPEVVLEGRPYGGLGFICKKLPGISYLTVNSENDRIGVLQILSNHKVLLTIIGVYMPYYDGTVGCIQEYSETLNDIQCIIDTNDVSPVMMNSYLDTGTGHGHIVNVAYYCMNLCPIMIFYVVTFYLNKW